MPKDATIDPLDKLMDQLKEFKEHLTPKEQAEIDSLDADQRKKRHLKIKKLLERAKKRAPVPMPTMKESNKRKTGVIA
jgi:predicted RNA-binding protein with RPS1 domain